MLHAVDAVLSNSSMDFPVDMVCVVCHCFDVSFHGPYNAGHRNNTTLI